MAACGCQEKGRILGAQEARREHASMGTELRRWVCELGLHSKVPQAGPLNDRDLLSHGARGRKAEIKVMAGLVLSEGSLLGV